MTKRIASLFLALSLLVPLAGVANATRVLHKIKEETARTTMIKAAREKFGLHGLNAKVHLPEGMGKLNQREIKFKIALTAKPNVKFNAAPPTSVTGKFDIGKTGGAKGTKRASDMKEQF